MLFAGAVSKIQFWRNKAIFEANFHLPSDPVELILQEVHEVKVAWGTQIIGNQRGGDLVKQLSPSHRVEFKLNVDGEYDRSSDMMEAGGLI